MQEGAVLDNRNAYAYKLPGIDHVAYKRPKNVADQRRVTRFMCDKFYDIRTFGAVMTFKHNCGQVRGPVQLCFAESVDPVIPQELTLTRIAVTNEGDDREHNFGRKQYTPYGLYRVHGFISASLAEKTGFSQADLDLLFEALMNMFENDRSAARGLMTSRKLVVFKHESKLGNAASDSLFERVTCKKVIDAPARHFSDYAIEVDELDLPTGVSVSSFDWIQPSA